MKRIALFAAALISFTAVAQDVTVVKVGSSRRPRPAATGPIPDSLRVFDRESKDFIAEPQYECLYNYVINNAVNGDTVEETTACMLQIGQTASRFSDYLTYAADSVRHIKGVDDYSLLVANDRERDNLYAYDEIVYHNMPAGKMTVYGQIPPQCYFYQEDNDPIEWEIIEGTETVCGYDCMMAEGNYGGRRWRAWFTADIPAALGPWKITGLPGLVLKAVDTDNIHSFEAIAFRRGEVPVYLPGWPAAVKIDRTKFIANKQQFESYDDPIKHIPDESITDIVVSKSGSTPILTLNGVPLRKKENGYVARELR